MARLAHEVRINVGSQLARSTAQIGCLHQTDGKIGRHIGVERTSLPGDPDLKRRIAGDVDTTHACPIGLEVGVNPSRSPTDAAGTQAAVMVGIDISSYTTLE